MSETTAGRRLADGERSFRPGDYGRVDGVWEVRPPNGHLGSLADHDVTEHPDGTITVSPSILDPEDPAVHWYLIRGEWRRE